MGATGIFLLIGAGLIIGAFSVAGIIYKLKNG